MIELFTRNPFAILELLPGATDREIEHQGRKILGMLELGIEKGASYTTPRGIQERDAASIRQAMAELHDPVRYHFHEFWCMDTTGTGPVRDQQDGGETEIDFLTAARFGN